VIFSKSQKTGFSLQIGYHFLKNRAGMFKKITYLFMWFVLPCLFCKCTTTQESASVQIPPVVVQGIMYYPDESSRTYIVPAGAEIVGAGGVNCRYVVESGGRMTAHTGTENIYEIKAGGSFKGFDHPATNCRVTYHNGASLEQVQAGTGVVFLLVP